MLVRSYICAEEMCTKVSRELVILINLSASTDLIISPDFDNLADTFHRKKQPFKFKMAYTLSTVYECTLAKEGLKNSFF